MAKDEEVESMWAMLREDLSFSFNYSRSSKNPGFYIKGLGGDLNYTKPAGRNIKFFY